MSSAGYMDRRIEFVAPVLSRNKMNVTSRKVSAATKKAIVESNNVAPIPDAWLRHPMRLPRGLQGLENLGQTCFLNSTLQAVSYLPPFMNVLARQVHRKCSCKTQGWCLMCEMEKHAEKIYTNKGKASAICPYGIVKNIRLIGRKFNAGRQEDAHEFLRFFIDCLQKNVDKHPKTPKLIERVFEGEFSGRIQCTECGYESKKRDVFQDLSIQLFKGRDVDFSLKRFFSTDTLEGQNKYRCDGCKRRVVAKKMLSIARVPPVLTIHLKRFELSMFGTDKIKYHVNFRPKLHLADFIDPSLPNKEDLVYELQSVVVHHGGGCRSGHYVSYVKSPSGVWYLLDDESVQKVGLKTVLSQKAYMLFYTRTTPHKPAQEPISVANPVSQHADMEDEKEDKLLLPMLKSAVYTAPARYPSGLLHAGLAHRIGDAALRHDSCSSSVYLSGRRAVDSDDEKSDVSHNEVPAVPAPPVQPVKLRERIGSVATWEDIDEQDPLLQQRQRILRECDPAHRRKRRSRYDIEYDLGKTKKTRGKRDTYNGTHMVSSSNPFQTQFQRRTGTA